MNNDAMEKIVMLRSSMRCFVYGLLGFLPVIGLPFAILSLWNSGRARVRERKYWNAAKAYRIWGVVFSTIAMLSALSTIAFLVINSIAPGIWYRAD